MKSPKRVLIALSLTVTTFAAHADEHVGVVSASTVGVGSSGAMALSRPLPGFPVAAMRSGNDYGRVVLSYDIAADGTVKDVQVVSARPVQVFTSSAVNAVEKWRYMPGATDRRVVEFTFVRN